MLTGITLSHVWVFDQDQALDFYAGKLGLEVSNDIDLGPMRWLTVRVPGRPGRDILLEEVAPPSLDEASAGQIRELVSKGASGFAVGFETDDCQQTYEDLKAKGVEIMQEPTVQMYGTDMAIRDPFGNQIRINQPVDQAELERRMKEMMPQQPSA